MVRNDYGNSDASFMIMVLPHYEPLIIMNKMREGCWTGKVVARHTIGSGIVPFNHSHSIFALLYSLYLARIIIIISIEMNKGIKLEKNIRICLALQLLVCVHAIYPVELIILFLFHNKVCNLTDSFFIVAKSLA